MKLIIYSLIGCPYSLKSEKILKPYTPQIIKVDQSEKDKFKKFNNMNTFPQIFLQDKSNKLIKIGGYDDTMGLLSDIFSKSNNRINSFNLSDKESLTNFFTNS
jgi:glutaredoxin-related protein